MGKSKIIAVDFDGVIHGYSKGWQNGRPYDQPVPGARQAMEKLISEGYHVMIYTTRCNPDYLEGSTVDRVQDVRDYLLINSIPFSEIYTGNGKPKATIYVDDRAIGFKGNWEQTVEEINSFETWNRPGAKSSAEISS